VKVGVLKEVRSTKALVDSQRAEVIQRILRHQQLLREHRLLSPLSKPPEP